LPTYEKVDSVRNTLTDFDVDASKFEKDGSLVISDSVMAYDGSDYDISATVEMLAKRAESHRGGGCSVISDMGSFRFLGKEQELFEYESSLASRFNSIKCKGFRCYNQANLDRLSENQKEQLFGHHHKNLIATEAR
jgi:hypothetical protein